MILLLRNIFSKTEHIFFHWFYISTHLYYSKWNENQIFFINNTFVYQKFRRKKKHDYVIRRKHSNFNKKVTLGHQTSGNTIVFDKITLNTGHKIYTLQFYWRYCFSWLGVGIHYFLNLMIFLQNFYFSEFCKLFHFSFFLFNT
jgi:hypothetical protein